MLLFEDFFESLFVFSFKFLGTRLLAIVRSLYLGNVKGFENLRLKVNRLILFLLETQTETRVCCDIELPLGGHIGEENLVTFVFQNHDTFLQVVKDFVVANPHSFGLNENHAYLGYDKVDVEEVEELLEAANDHLDDQCCRDFLAVEEFGRGN